MRPMKMCVRRMGGVFLAGGLMALVGCVADRPCRPAPVEPSMRGEALNPRPAENVSRLKQNALPVTVTTRD